MNVPIPHLRKKNPRMQNPSYTILNHLNEGKVKDQFGRWMMISR
jgi:hypothetical protein